MQYTALSFGKKFEESGIVSSKGRAGSVLDNATLESFVATLKIELVHPCCFRTREVATRDIFDVYLKVFYNRRRLHCSFGYVSPEGFEDLGTKEMAVT